MTRANNATKNDSLRIAANKALRIERKCEVLRLLKSKVKLTHKQIAEIAKCSVGTVNAVWKEFRKNPNLKESDFTEKKRGPAKNQFKKIPEFFQILIIFILQACLPSQFGIDTSTWCAEAIQNLLVKISGISVKRSYIYYILKRMHVSSKFASRVNPKRSLDAINLFVEKQYREIVRQALRRGDIIVFCDECHLQKLHHVKGYSPVGIRSTVEFTQGANHTAYTLMVVMGPSGFLHEILVKGTMDSEKFIQCLEIVRKANKGKRFTLIMDNAPIHTSKETMKYLNDGRRGKKYYTYFFLPKYAPERNPVEYKNNDFKGDMRRLGGLTEAEIHDNAIDYITRDRNNLEYSRERTRKFFEAEQARYALDIYNEEVENYKQELEMVS